jgi:hypothetical protein
VIAMRTIQCGTRAHTCATLSVDGSMSQEEHATAAPAAGWQPDEQLHIGEVANAWPPTPQTGETIEVFGDITVRRTADRMEVVCSRQWPVVVLQGLLKIWPGGFFLLFNFWLGLKFDRHPYATGPLRSADVRRDSLMYVGFLCLVVALGGGRAVAQFNRFRHVCISKQRGIGRDATGWRPLPPHSPDVFVHRQWPLYSVRVSGFVWKISDKANAIGLAEVISDLPAFP